MKAQIALEGLSFYAYHGYYEEERRSGNKFSVDVKAYFTMEENQDPEDLDNTVNYERIYSIVKSVMHEPQHLLETVCRNILKEVFSTWPFITSCEVSITKFHPPVGGPCDKAKVTLSESR